MCIYIYMCTLINGFSIHQTHQITFRKLPRIFVGERPLRERPSGGRQTLWGSSLRMFSQKASRQPWWHLADCENRSMSSPFHPFRSLFLGSRKPENMGGTSKPLVSVIGVTQEPGFPNSRLGRDSRPSCMYFYYAGSMSDPPKLTEFCNEICTCTYRTYLYILYMYIHIPRI